MIINIPLGGQIRRIKWDGLNFRALPLTGDNALGYYTRFGNALAKLVKDVANTDEYVKTPEGEKQFNEEVLTMQQFVRRFELILDDIKSITPDHFKAIQSIEEPEVTNEPEKEKQSITEAVFASQDEEEDTIDGL